MTNYNYFEIEDFLFGQLVSIKPCVYKKGFLCWKYEVETCHNERLSIFDDDSCLFGENLSKLELLYHPDHMLTVAIMNDRFVHLSIGGKTEIKYEDIENIEYINGTWLEMPGLKFTLDDGTEIIKHYHYDKVCRILFNALEEKL